MTSTSDGIGQSPPILGCFYLCPQNESATNDKRMGSNGAAGRRGRGRDCALPEPALVDQYDCLPVADSRLQETTRIPFDIGRCVPPNPRPAPDPSRPPLSEESHLELASLLAKLQSQAEAGASPVERLTLVAQLVVAHIATWLKPAASDELSPAELRLPGVLGQHTIRRCDSAGLFWQSMATLRTSCFSDQYLHASQAVLASMRINVQPRIEAQGSGGLLVFLDGVPPPPRDVDVEREAEAARAASPPHPQPPALPAESAMVVELGGASWYGWEKRHSVPAGAPPTTPAEPAIPADATDPSAGGLPPASVKETYRIKLPALKISGLERGTPTVSIVRSATVECAATGLVARLRFLPFRPLKDARFNIVVGSLGCPRPAPPAPPTPLPRRRSVGGATDGGGGSLLSSFIPRRRSTTNVRRTLSGAAIMEEADEAPWSVVGGATEAAPAAEQTSLDMSLFGMLDGRIFLSPTTPGPAPGSAPTLLWDDEAMGVPTAPLSDGWGVTASLAPALRSPVLMQQRLLWTAVVDALRTALSEGRAGAHPATLDVLGEALQREGAQVTAAKEAARAAGKRTNMAFAQSWMLATPPTTTAAPALEHVAPRVRRLK